MTVHFTQIDAFAGEAFRGNPAAVVVLTEWPSTRWMQDVAAEMNLSETAFLVPFAAPAAAKGKKKPTGMPAQYELRWFTPAVEVDLCGHATLASAWLLWEAEHAAADGPIVFHTRSGELTATRAGEWIELDFPALEPTASEAPVGLAAALGVEPRWVGKSRFDYLVQVDDEGIVRALQPDLNQLRRVEARGVMVTAAAEPGTGCHFVSRFFAPRAGVAEDPVTGSAHCCLAPFWARRLGRQELIGYQASQRGGVVRVRVSGDRVALGGRAVPVFTGEILVPPTPA